jgi:TonB family protein
MDFRLSSLLFCTLLGSSYAQDSWVVQRLTAADYPLLAQQARIQGSVELRCDVAGSGEVLECKAISGHPLLQRSAIANAIRWRFRKQSTDGTANNQIALLYEFAFAGAPVRTRPKVEFSFEFPSLVRVVSEIPCADHIPCTADEVDGSQKSPKGKGRRIIP